MYIILGNDERNQEIADKLQESFGFYVLDLDAIIKEYPYQFGYPMLVDTNIRNDLFKILQHYNEHIVIISNAVWSKSPEMLVQIGTYFISTDELETDSVKRLRNLVSNSLYEASEIDFLLQKEETIKYNNLNTSSNILLEGFLKKLKEDLKMDKSLEQSIREQMISLGLVPDDKVDEQKLDNTQVQDVVEPEMVLPKVAKPVKKNKPEKIAKEVDQKLPEEILSADTIFCKIRDREMAIMIPQDLKMETRQVGGKTFLVAKVEIPDWSNCDLQELKQVKETTTKPVKTEEPSKKPAKPVKHVIKVDTTKTLEEYQAEKSDLDSQIKQARKDGDENLVNSLRAKRRAIRKIINSMKVQKDDM